MSKKKGLSYTYRRNKQRQAAKKDIQGIIIIVIVSIIIAVAVIMGLIFLGVSKDVGRTVYPSSPLVKDVTKYSYVESDSLPHKVMLPSRKVMISMGGSERYRPQNGYVYLYSPDMYISAYELYGTTYDLYSTYFINDLYAGEIGYSWLYTQEIDYKGYYNGYPATYECGKCDLFNDNGIITKTIYLVSFTLDMGLDYPVNITVSTPTENNLFSAGKLLEKLGNTIVDVSKTAYVDSNTLSSTGEANVGVPVFY